MPAGVKEAFVKDVACNVGKLSREEAEHFIQSLENTGYFQSETWAWCYWLIRYTVKIPLYWEIKFAVPFPL